MKIVPSQVPQMTAIVTHYIEQGIEQINIKKEYVWKKPFLEKGGKEGTSSDTDQESPPSIEVLQEEGKILIHVAQETDTSPDNYQRLSDLSRWTPDEVKERIQAVQP
jgi:hypothetical protein